MTRDELSEAMCSAWFGAQDWAMSPHERRKYPCSDCGVLRTKAEGGTTFTVCDECWDKRSDEMAFCDLSHGPRLAMLKARDAEWKQMVADAQADAREAQQRAQEASHLIQDLGAQLERLGITEASETWWKPGPMSDADASEWARLNCGPLESCTPELYEQTLVDVSVAVRNTVNIAAARGRVAGLREVINECTRRAINWRSTPSDSLAGNPGVSQVAVLAREREAIAIAHSIEALIAKVAP